MKSILLTLNLLIPLSFLLAGDPIPFDVVNGLIIVNAEVDGESMPFIFDSGANELIINKEVISSKKVAFSTSTGEAIAQEIVVKKMKLGNSLELTNKKAYAMDLTHIGQWANEALGGILGADLLGIYDLNIDFENQLITFEKTNSNLKFSSKFVNKGGVVIVKVDIDGTKYNFLLDSGSSCHLLDKQLMNNHIIPGSSTSNELLTAAGESAVHSGNINFEFGNRSYTNQKIIAVDLDLLSQDLGVKLAGVLSVSQLNMKYLSIDNSKGIVSFI